MDLQKISRPSTQLNLKKADKNATPMTFDVSKVKSTVENPSQIFKWISVEDEKKILSKVNQMYPNWSKFEKQQAIQGLYNAALNSQKQKDIDAWRQQIKLDLINKANNSNWGRQKNEYMVQVKKADLADLIKEQLVKDGYKASDMLNITDDWIISWFLKTNPEYKDSFNKYFYNKQDATQLWKELWWIEKNKIDIVWDKLEWFAEWMAWWMPKRWEWVKEFLDWGLAWTDQNINRNDSLDSAAFWNYVQEKYWTVPANLTEKDLAWAKMDFENANKKEYTPNLASASTKMAEWLTDIAFTAWWLKGANLLRNNLFKAWFAWASQTPWLQIVPEALWDTLSVIGSYINKLPWFSNIRENLRTEQDKADWDAFVAWNVLALFKWWKRKFNEIKDADIQWWKNSFDKIKQWELREWVDTLKENARQNRSIKLEEQKLKNAQKITQWEIETRKTASNWLDLLNEEWKLDNIKSVDDLKKNVDETVDRLKKEQTEIAQWEQKRFWQADLWLPEEAEVLDNNGNKTTQKVISYPIDTLLDRIIEHYKDVDKTKATTFESYKRALKNWTLPAETILEIRREWNSLNQKVYNNKTNQYKDTDKAQQWAKNMEKVNWIIEWLDIGEDLRKRDSQLSSLYTIQEWLKNIRKAEENFNKWAIEKSWVEKMWGWISKWIWKLSFGTSNLFTKFVVSILQDQLWWWAFMKQKYNASEIAWKIPEFVQDYQNLLKKIETGRWKNNLLRKSVDAFVDKWNLEALYNEED